MADFDLRVICLGAGVQSSTMYLMACEGLIIPKPDAAIFADTQAEPQWVYDQLDYLASKGDIPIRKTTAGNLADAVRLATNSTGQRFASVPFWTNQDGKRGMGRRQCTREYKIDPIKQEIRRMLGLSKGERASGRFRVEELVGISLDEATRMKPSRTPWITTRWPLLFDVPMRRSECLTWMQQKGHPLPKKSACYFCPYRTNREWRDLRDNAPDLFAKAIEMDETIRVNRMRGMKHAQYLHDSLMPLAQVDIDPDPDQPDLFQNECEGMCGV